MQEENEVSDSDVLGLARECLQKYRDEMGWVSRAEVKIDIMEFYEAVIYPEYEIRLLTDYDLGCCDGQKILGKTIPNEGIILVDKSINQQSKDPRFTFTLGHEIGHAILHAKPNTIYRCTEDSICYEGQNLREYQANLFAANLIMPAKFVRDRYIHHYGDGPFLYSGPGYYDIAQGVYVDSFGRFGWQLARPLTGYFSNISKQSLAYRMCRLGLIINQTAESLFGAKKLSCNGVIS